MTTTNPGKNVSKLNPSYIAVGHVIWHSYSENEAPPILPINYTPGHLSQRNRLGLQK